MARQKRPLIEQDGLTRDFAQNEWELVPTRAGSRAELAHGTNQDA